MPRETRNRPAGGTAVASAGVAARAQHDAERPAAAPASARAGRHRRLLFAAVSAQPAHRRPAGDVGLRPRCAATDPWLPGADEAALVADAFGRRAPTLVADTARQTPDLAGATRHARRAAAAARPRARAGRAAGGRLRPSAGAGDVERRPPWKWPTPSSRRSSCFTCARAKSCSATSASCSTSSPASLSATLNLAAGLDIFCHGANRLFGADRTSVWIHDRRARQLVLQASSDPADVARGVRVETDDVLGAGGDRHAPHPRGDRAAGRRRGHGAW